MRIVLIMLTVVMITLPPAIFVTMELEEEERGDELVVETIPPTSTMHSPLVYLAPPPDDLLEPIHINLRWNGFDLPRDGEISSFDVQYRYSYIQDSYIPEMGYPYFTDWIDLYIDTESTSEEFEVRGGMAYQFRVRAEDGYGNVEDWPTTEDTRTFVYSLPGYVFKVIRTVQPFIEEAREEVGERLPAETPPHSRVLPLQPVFLPGIDDEKIMEEDILIHPMLGSHISVHDIIHMNWQYPETTVEWSGNDPKGGDITFDIQHRRIFLDDDNRLLPDLTNMYIPTLADTGWIDWQIDSTETSCEYQFPGPGLYEFRSRAEDDAGNVERYPMNADAWAYVLPSPGEHMRPCYEGIVQS